MPDETSGLLRIVAQTGSTNADLARALRDGESLPEGLWLLADRQSAGRGRLGRSWFDGAGNFMGSCVVRPMPGDPPAASLALVAGLAVHATVCELFAGASPGDAARCVLKWPNDLLLDGAKVSGILLESVAGAVIVGIGVNLVAAPSLAERRTCALADHGLQIARDDFAAALMARFARQLQAWRDNGLPGLVPAWEAAAHHKGAPLRVSPPGEAALDGHFAGLTPEGNLLLTLADGTKRVVHAGDVELGG